MSRDPAYLVGEIRKTVELSEIVKTRIENDVKHFLGFLVPRDLVVKHLVIEFRVDGIVRLSRSASMITPVRSVSSAWYGTEIRLLEYTLTGQ